MSESNKFTKQEWTWIIVVSLFIPLMLWGLFAEVSRRRHIQAVMAGPIRGNKNSRRFELPTCPNYESIHSDNLQLFQTMEEADAAGYRPARNCSDDDLSIREINETEQPDGPDHPGDQQYR